MRGRRGARNLARSRCDELRRCPRATPTIAAPHWSHLLGAPLAEEGRGGRLWLWRSLGRTGHNRLLLGPAFPAQPRGHK